MAEHLDTLCKRRTNLKESLPFPGLRYSSAAVLNDKLYIIEGGYDVKCEKRMNDDGDDIDDEGMMVTYHVTSDAVYCLADHPTDPSAATWALQSARLNITRYGHASIAFEGKVWVAGGHDGGYRRFSSVEVYDPAVGVWKRAPDMTKERCRLTLMVVGDELYAVCRNQHIEELMIEKLSKVSAAWEVVTTLQEGRLGSSAAVVGSKIYVFGGGLSRIQESTWNAFDVLAGQWASVSVSYENRKLPRNDFSVGTAISVPSCLDNGKRMTWDN